MSLCMREHAHEPTINARGDTLPHMRVQLILISIVGTCGWCILDDERHHVRCFDDQGNVLFSGFGTESEIRRARASIERIPDPPSPADNGKFGLTLA